MMQIQLKVLLLRDAITSIVLLLSIYFLCFYIDFFSVRLSEMKDFEKKEDIHEKSN